MIADWQTLTAPQYGTDLYNFLVTVETDNHRHPDYTAYPDSRGFLSIGVEFNLKVAANKSAVHANFGLILNDPALTAPMYAALNAQENAYIAALNAAIANTDAATFNATLLARSNNAALTAVLGPLPSALTDASAQAIFNTIIGTYESQVNSWLAGIPDSWERIALVSLAYNSRTNPAGIAKTLGGTLLAAIQAGNRAEAWYEIRYGTNPSEPDSNGIAKRRYYESQTFSIFATPGQPTLSEALQAYEALAGEHKDLWGFTPLPAAIQRWPGSRPLGRDASVQITAATCRRGHAFAFAIADERRAASIAFAAASQSAC